MATTVLFKFNSMKLINIGNSQIVKKEKNDDYQSSTLYIIKLITNGKGKAIQVRAWN